MWSSDRRAYAAVALVALASLCGIAPADARPEAREQHEQRRPSEGERQGTPREARTRPAHRAQTARPPVAHARARRQASYTREHPATTYHPRPAARSIAEWHPASAGVARAVQPAGNARVSQVYHTPAGDQLRVVRYGNSASGTVERTIRPGFMSRSFVSGGQVLYTRVYQDHVWHQFGRAFAYQTFVPAVRFPGVYYSWALGAWRHPVAYTWGWRVQPWYPLYGVLFTPYPVYASPDLWMTDYILAQNMQAAYQAQSPAPPASPPPGTTWSAPAADSDLSAPDAQPGDTSAAPQPDAAAPAPQPIAAPSAPAAAPPPAITPQIKAQLNTQIKVQLEEQQAAQAMPATLTTQSGPPALRANHVFFEVVQPLDVPTAHGHCSLSANDYIKRTGPMSSDDWMIPVVVELSRPSDCPEGLATRIGLNDLNAMENEQEAQVLEAMQAASKSMGPNGPPSGVQPTLIADGSATPDPMALHAFQQAQ
ncbi:MAG TPA: hypothetical protein VLV25_03310 [Steroidobacteraceae bacterium]|nr:hypothetical protein [Steroidobacteraceae bacterium]